MKLFECDICDFIDSDMDSSGLSLIFASVNVGLSFYETHVFYEIFRKNLF